MKEKRDYYVYILRCAGDSYYVGYAEDLQKRLKAHSEGRASPYTKKRLPVELLYSEDHGSIESARLRERQIKRWTRKKKEALISGDMQLIKELSKKRLT